MFLRALLVFVSALALTHAHLCVLNPVQRGTMVGINKPAANDCILLKGPCGGRQSRGYPDIAYKAGSNVTVLFQKNLDHFDKSKPGYFSLSIGNSYPGLKEVSRVPDRGEPSLTIYNATVTMPPTPDPFHILQVTYVTNNPQAPPVFYQCSDFRIF